VPERRPFEDVVRFEGGFSIPELKWRELLFVGALRAEAGLFVRDPARPLPPFLHADLFPDGAAFEACHGDGRVRLTFTPRPRPPRAGPPS
jgi:hypothetical protein